jgi:hypothetical protein
MGNIYLSGIYYGRVSFGATSLSANTGREIFTGRIDARLSPVISSQPTSQSVAIGQSVTLGCFCEWLCSVRLSMAQEWKFDCWCH